MLKNQLLTRRRALWMGLLSVTSIGTIATARTISEKEQTEQILRLENLQSNFAVIEGGTLKERAAAKGLIYGAATHKHKLSSDTSFAKHFVCQCGILVPEGELKWRALRPNPHIFDFTLADSLAEFCQNHNILFRGHTLIWHQSIPTWFKEKVDPQNAQKFFREHIATVTRHYAGKIHSWDVVNEAIEVKDGKNYGLRNTPWLNLLGSDYIELAFRIAAEADPNALLTYNDYGLEYDTKWHEARRNAVLKLLERLISKGTPIHAFGMQSHLTGDLSNFNSRKLRNFLTEIASLGLKIMITELDVTDKKLPAPTIIRDRIVAQVYKEYLSVTLDEKAVIAVLTWGLTDKYTWLSEYSPRLDGRKVRPLPFDEHLQPKLAWNAIAKAFDNAPKR
jgi:endo-1,4-beta-xylanase